MVDEGVKGEWGAPWERGGGAGPEGAFAGGFPEGGVGAIREAPPRCALPRFPGSLPIGALLIPTVLALLSACQGEERSRQAEATEAALPLAGILAQLPQGERASDLLSAGRQSAIVRAAERISPSVVTVHVLRTQQLWSANSFWDGFPFPFGMPRGPTSSRLVPSLGSGFVLDASGVILTNDHVVRGAERILVTFPDGRDLEAQLVGTDQATDVAVLRVAASGLPAVPLGGTHDLQIGEWVIAFGNPFGNLLSNTEPTVTVGVTSALGRHIVPSEGDRGFYLGMIQTDAAINPGNSGGPLVNAEGEVIGMNTSIFSQSGGNEGLGFAIPIERVLRIASDLLEFGEVRRAWLGLLVEPEEADIFGRTRGVRVARVASGAPGSVAGVQVGDRVLGLNGRRLISPLDFEAALLDLRAGDRVLLEIEGAARSVEVMATELPSLQAQRVRVFQEMELITLTPAIRAERGVESESGALVARISPQIQAVLGVQEGDLIVALNNRRVGSAEELSAVLAQIPAGTRVRLYFERNRGFAATDFVLGQ